MYRDGSNDLWEAVRSTPGIVLSGGGRRNDSNFSVRGFGMDSVPVYVDGIPLANPYRGEGDSARILYRDTDYFRLPASFEASPNNPQQSGDRLWSDSKDFKLTLIAGTAPLAGLDVWLAYVYQDADKGVSPPDEVTRDYAIWD
jgi:hypothetical protein